MPCTEIDRCIGFTIHVSVTSLFLFVTVCCEIYFAFVILPRISSLVHGGLIPGNRDTTWLLVNMSYACSLFVIIYAQMISFDMDLYNQDYRPMWATRASNADIQWNTDIHVRMHTYRHSNRRYRRSGVDLTVFNMTVKIRNTSSSYH